MPWIVRAAKSRWLKTWRLLGPLGHSSYPPPPMGVTGRKKLGGQKEICLTLWIVPDHFRKKFFWNKLISATNPPPPPSFGFLAFLFPTFCPTYVEYLHDFSTLWSFWGGAAAPRARTTMPPPPDRAAQIIFNTENF